MAARMAAQRRGLQMRQKQRDLLSFALLLPVHIIISDCPHSLFPHQQVLLGSWRLLSITHSGQQVDSGKGGDHPSIGRTYIPIIPIANLSFKCQWMHLGGILAREEDIPQLGFHSAQYINVTILAPITTSFQYYSCRATRAHTMHVTHITNKQTSKGQPMPMQKDMHPRPHTFLDVLMSFLGFK